MEFEVWIRTFQDRVYLADRLKQACVTHLTANTHILNTQEASATYQEKFVLSLYFSLRNTNSAYILILEDDIGFRKESLQVIQKAIARGRTHLWLTIPTDACLNAARKIDDHLYRLARPLRLYYSGAVLVSKNVLKRYVESYLLNHAEYPYKNFDTTFSTHLSTHFGFIDLAPSFFGSLPYIESAADLCRSDTSRLDVDRSALDPLFDPQTIVSELKSHELVR